MQLTSLKKLFLLLVIVSAIGGVLLNLYLALSSGNDLHSQSTIFVNVFSYFTIQSNLLVALVCAGILWRKNFFGKYEQLFHLGALVDISITFAVVQLILSKLVSYEGIVLFADNLVHIITPALFVAYWFLFHNKQRFAYRNVFVWLIYPLLYLAYSLLRGLSVNWYPYPFINANLISYQQILLNSVGLFVAFVVTGAVFTAANNFLAKGQI